MRPTEERPGPSPFPWPAPPVPGAGTEPAGAAELAQTAVQPGEDETSARRPAERGTDPVPVVGRFPRRSRREHREALPEPGAGAQTAPAVETPTGSAAAAALAPAPRDVPPAPGDVPVPPGRPSKAPPEAPGTATSSPPVVDGRPLTRRELREREQARRAAEPGGVGRRLRALTGSIPVVRPSAPSGPPESSQVDGEAPAAAQRAAAWRQAWGFTPTGDTDTNDGGNR